MSVDYTGIKLSSDFWSNHHLSYERLGRLGREQNMQCFDCTAPIELPPWAYSACIHHDKTCCSGKYSCGKCIVAILCLGCVVRRRFKNVGYKKDPKNG